MKWFGGYPVNNLNTQYNTTLRFIEDEYIDVKNLATNQEHIKSENEQINELKKNVGFISKLDKVIANQAERDELKTIEKLINNSLNVIDNSNKQENKKKVSIFISHSSKDAKVIKSFTDKILQLALKINRDDIFCTSIEECSIVSGEDFRKVIKEKLQNATHVVQIITWDYKKSEVCMNEMGAAWVLNSKVKPFIIDPVDYESVGFINSPNQLLKLNQKQDLLKFIDEMKNDLITITSHTEVDRHIEDFLNELDLRIQNRGRK